MTDSIARLNAALDGRYRIERELGAGGMAVVFLADDLRHERKVALKVLRPEVAAVVGGDRFLAEIKTTANFQHPHILPLFDSGEADGFLYYVMPYVEGETLRDRLDREGQLSIAEATRIASAVAGALQVAHDAGVIHRDIKPANILLSRGEPLVADFGIALAVSAGGGDRLTETGLSIGTPYYMSPEQATGDQRIGPAADIYALGCVLYEMLVGEPPYLGSSAQAVLGRIIQGEPVWPTEARRSIPVHVDAAIRKALERLPADRFEDADDFARALGDPSFRHGEAVATTSSPGWWRPAAIAAGALAFALGVWAMAATPPPVPGPVARYHLRFPPGEEPVTVDGAFGTSVAVSPSGDRVAYVGPAGEGGYGIWVRERDALEGRLIPGTENGVQPFFSPDGQQVGFIVTGTRELKVASLSGAPPLTLVRSGAFRLGGGWSDDGYIYYSGQPDGGLYRLPAAGGEPEHVSTPDTAAGETRHAWPQPLPDGRGVLVTVQRGDNLYTPEDDVGVLDLATGDVAVLLRATLARYVDSGHIVIVTHEGDLLAAPFDPDGLAISGPTSPLRGSVVGAVRGPDLALSASGRLVFQPTQELLAMELVWVDRTGRVVPVDEGWTELGLGLTQSGPALSPDGSRIALAIPEDPGNIGLWIKDLDGPLTRIAFGGINSRPAWSRDGRSVSYITDRYDGQFLLVTQPADGSGAERVLADPEWPVGEGRWAPDGETLILRGNGTPFSDIYAVRPGLEEVPRMILGDSAFRELSPQLSPDGRWMAYTSNVSGQFEVYVRPFPDVDAARVAVSTDGGAEPLWSRSGDELFYKNRDDQLVSVIFDTRDGFRVRNREILFDLPDGLLTRPVYSQYDITPDGQEFLMYRVAGGAPPPVTDEYIVVDNFQREILEAVGR